MNSTLSSELQSGLAMDLPQLSDHVRTVLSTGQFSSETVETLRAACVEALRGSVALRKDEAHLAAACRIVECFLQAGVADRPVSAEFAAKLDVECGEGWGGLLAAMVQAPAWQLVAAPRLGDAPLPLWPVYTEWLFRLPVRAELPGQLDAMAGHYMQRLRELVAVAESNRGSAAVNAALDRYAQAESAPLLVASSVSLRDLVALRGKVLGLLHKVPKAEEALLIPREGRRLRIGLILNSADEGTESRFSLPWIESLDSSRFEIAIFSAQNYSSSRLLEFSELGWDLRGLSGNFEADIQSLNDSALDIAFLVTRPLHADDPITRIALRRVAPLQICLNDEGLAAGLTQSDLIIVESHRDSDSLHPQSGDERVALLPYAGIPFVRSQGRPASTCAWSREDLGISSGAVVYASIAPFRFITPEVLDCWTRILSRIPAARLLVYSYSPEDASSEQLTALCGAVASACLAAGVEPTRFILSNEQFPSLSEVIELLRLADVYLDTFPASAREGCQLAMEAGLPLLCRVAARDRVSHAGLALAATGMTQYVCCDDSALVARAEELARRADLRVKLTCDLRSQLASPSNVFDAVAFGESFGALLETAFDLRACDGASKFRKDRTPIALPIGEDFNLLRAEVDSFATIGLAFDFRSRAARVLASAPAQEPARVLYYQQLERSGDSKRAVDGLLALVERMPQRADLWLMLGRNLMAIGKRTDALTAYETALRIDGTLVEGWLLLAEAGMQSENWAPVKQIREILAALAPNDPRVAEMVSRLERYQVNE